MPKLKEVGDKCIQDREYNLSAKAYKLANDNESLNKLGELCIKEGFIETGYEIYELAGNSIMVEFIKENFQIRN